MLTLTYQDLVTAGPALRELTEGHAVSPRLALRIYRIIRLTNDALQDYDRARSDIVDRYTERDADGKPAPVLVDGKPAPNRVRLTDPEAAERELGDLLAETVQLDAEPLRASALLAEAELQVTPATLYRLGPLFVDDEEPRPNGRPAKKAPGSKRRKVRR